MQINAERGAVMRIKIKDMTEEQRRIRDDLLDQLRKKNQDTSYFIDLVNDYIDMMQTRDRLQEDIRVHGTLIEYKNGANQAGWKKNDSLEQKNKINDRMIKLLDFLGIKPSETIVDDDDDDL